MLFSSLPFLYYFLPAALIIYFISPQRLKNTCLVLISLVFYGWGEPEYVLLMMFSILAGWVSGLLLEKFKGKRPEKPILILSTAVSLSFLFVFKYADFTIDNLNRLFGLGIPLLKLTLPIGISFYTFQIISYIVDVYRGQAAAQHNIINLAAYVSLFPQLIAGPIVRYPDVEKGLRHREQSFENFALGMRRFILGLGKKILIANLLGELCVTFKASGDKSVLFHWIYALSFSLHIYYDFSGYSDMAIGLGRVFGFKFPENFNYPYMSRSVTEFWRRWHISLGSWFRDYVYIPMGGNRVSRGRWFINIFTVWLLTGFWHGADWNFVVWGLYFAVLLVLEKLVLLKYIDKSKILSRIYLIFTVMVSFVIFDSSSMGEAVKNIGGLFGAGGIPLSSKEAVYYLKDSAVILLIAVSGTGPWLKNFCLKLGERPRGAVVRDLAEPVVLIGLMLLMTAFLVDGSFNPFLYFRF